MHSTSKAAIRPVLAFIALASVAVAPIQAQDAKPADAKLVNQLDPNAPDKDSKILEKYQAVKVDDGKYFDKDGAPTYHITNDGKKLDWYAYSG